MAPANSKRRGRAMTGCLFQEMCIARPDPQALMLKLSCDQRTQGKPLNLEQAQTSPFSFPSSRLSPRASSLKKATVNKRRDPFGFPPFGFLPFGFLPLGFPFASHRSDPAVHSSMTFGALRLLSNCFGDFLQAVAGDHEPIAQMLVLESRRRRRDGGILERHGQDSVQSWFYLRGLELPQHPFRRARIARPEK